MPTLSQLTGETRTIFKVLGIILGVIFLFFIVVTIKNILFPAPPPPPTVSFGKLTPPDLPLSSKIYDYKIETVTNSLPNVVSQERVYKIEGEQADLLALSRATDKVRQVGFTDPGTKISDNVYQWTDSDTGRTLTMNIMDNNFNMVSNFLQTNTPQFVGNANTAISAAKDFLSKMNLYKDDFDDSKTQVALFSVNNFSLIPATSLSNTQVVRVSFFQKDIKGIPIFYPQTLISPVNFLIGNVKGENQVIEANFFYQKPSETSSTYPLKTTQQAFNELKSGKAYIASYLGQGNSVSINKIYLGYFFSERRQAYLMPIIVFEGSDGFLAFVSAVKDEWVSK